MKTAAISIIALFLTIIASAQAATGTSLADRGASDAHQYYWRYHSARRGTFATSALLNPVLGLIPAISCATTPPKEKNLGYPNMELSQQPEYANAYRLTARHIKARKTWGGYFIGSIISATIIAIALSAH